jgi:hypothetical protein
MRKIRFQALAAVASIFCAIGAIATACSGKTSDTPGGGVDGATADAPSPNAADCPTAAPTQDSACSHDGLLCEYGNDFDPLCNTIVVCSGTRWASPVFFGGAQTCPSKPLPSQSQNPADCAPSRAAVPEGNACTSSSTCAYDGATCTCGSFCPSFPIEPPPCDDAGKPQGCCDKSKIQWHCFDGPAYCPTPRPRIGSSCSQEGAECATGAPVECGQSIIACKSGVWNVVNTACPVSTARAKTGIAYLSASDTDALHDDVMRIRLATYRYRSGDDATHLGFIIEDMPSGSPAVMRSREHVDLYGYTSMAVAALQKQDEKIAALERRIAELETARSCK